MSNIPKAVTNTATNIRLGFGRQVGYGIGEFAGQFFYSFWSSYLSVYYTDVVGIGPAIVGVIMMIALLLSYLCMFGRLGVAVYYYIYCLNKPMMVGLLMMLPPAAGIIPQYLVPKLKVSKKLLVIIAFAVRAITLVGIYFGSITQKK